MEQPDIQTQLEDALERERILLDAIDLWVQARDLANKQPGPDAETALEVASTVLEAIAHGARCVRSGISQT